MNKIIKWFDNYWYHYKAPTLIIGFMVLIILVLVVQCSTKTDDDVTILYAGPAMLTEGEKNELTSALALMLDGDYNGDGVKQVGISDLLIMTDEQYQQAQEEADANGTYLYVNKQTISENRTRFSTQVFAGEAVICILDPDLYKTLYNAGGVAALKDVLGYTPEYSSDGYCVKLCDTPFAQYFTAFSVFDEDTLICCRATSTMSSWKSTTGELSGYQCQTEFFKKLMEFSIEQ